MREISLLMAWVVMLLLSTRVSALEPDAAQVGSDVSLSGSHGHFVTRTADIFIDDNTNFDSVISMTTEPFVLRALAPYDMHLDPGWDQNGWALGASRQKLTAPGETKLRVGSGADLIVSSVAGDPVLYIDLAAFYDDNEPDDIGGFWANMRLVVTPIQMSNGQILQADARFRSVLRGPFWSGEKLEVADTQDGFRPQVMHYTNLGIWNWQWMIPGLGRVHAVEVKIDEGDGLLPDDHLVTYVVQRDETSQGPITLADTGEVVSVSITDDGRFQREMLDTTGLDLNGQPRISHNPDGLDVDVRFSTRPLQVPTQPRNQFDARHVLGPYRIAGTERIEWVHWMSAGLNWGTTVLRYIDNVSYTPGWDCHNFPFNDPFNVDDDFEFSLQPDPTRIEVRTDRGGCEDRTTLFFRASEVHLPDAVIVKRHSEAGVRVRRGPLQHFAIAKTPGYEGFAFTELLGYLTNGDDDVGFQITKGETADQFTFAVQIFSGNSGSGIGFRATSVEWPAGLAVATRSSRLNTRADASGAAHIVRDLPIPLLDQPYMVIHEMLTYQSSGDDDMSWGLYFEALGDHVSVQLASGNAGNDSGAYVEAESRVVQFPVVPATTLTR